MISFEFHLEKRHEKTQEPLRLLGFWHRYLFRCYLLARSTEKDITGFLGKSACDKVFSNFLYFLPFDHRGRRYSSSFSLRSEKDIKSMFKMLLRFSLFGAEPQLKSSFQHIHNYCVTNQPFLYERSMLD